MEDRGLYEQVPYSSPTLAQTSKNFTATATMRPRVTTACPIPGCGRSLLQRTFARHLRTVHKHGASLKCEICDEVFLRPDSLRRHQDEQHRGSGHDVECERCGKTIARRALGEHQRRRGCKNHMHLGLGAQKTTASIEWVFFIADGNSSVLASVSYLIEVIAHRIDEDLELITLLSTRQHALRSLITALGRQRKLDVESLSAICVFAMADRHGFGHAGSHESALKKGWKDLHEPGALLHEILVGALQQCNRSRYQLRLFKGSKAILAHAWMKSTSTTKLAISRSPDGFSSSRFSNLDDIDSIWREKIPLRLPNHRSPINRTTGK